MFFEQLYLGCLSHASYLLGSEGVAIVVDPQRDVDLYLKMASDHSLRIEHIFETHLHADFVSGHRELAARTGAKVYISREAKARFPHTAIDEGFELTFGKCRLRVLATPGHTLESISILVFDPERGERPWAVLTGDTLFIGDVGRPDLSPEYTSQQLASMLFDSLHDKMMTLPDDVVVYPAHGAGSLCGRNLREERFSTIGTERLTNYALQITNRDEFVRQVTSNLPPPPEYFGHDAEINRDGAVSLNELIALPRLSCDDLQQMIASDAAIALDIRPGNDFAEGHVPGSVNVGLSGQFASWAGILFGLDTPLVLIADTEDQVQEARTRLARVGIEKVIGLLDEGFPAWKDSSRPIARINRIPAQRLLNQQSTFAVFDVRRQAEFEQGHLAGAVSLPLDNFRVHTPDVPPDTRVAVHCKSGYRSIIAASLLQRAGFIEVWDVIGGFDALQKLAAPLGKEEPAVR